MNVMDHMPSGHLVQFKIGQSSPLLGISLGAIVVLVIQFVIPTELLMKSGFTMAQSDVHVDEDLPDFFDVVKLVDAN